MSSNSWRPSHVLHHRAPAIATAGPTTDAYGTTLRGDQHLIAAAPVVVPPSQRWGAVALTAQQSRPTAELDSVRTRGPPASRV